MTRKEAPFDCPYCGSQVKHVTHTNATYECVSCGERTHEKIEERRERLEELAETDNPAAELAKYLTEPANEWD